jgi:hypothetical protein
MKGAFKSFFLQDGRNDLAVRNIHLAAIGFDKEFFAMHGTKVQKFGAGCWMLDPGCWILDAGCWVLGFWHWILDNALPLQGEGWGRVILASL